MPSLRFTRKNVRQVHLDIGNGDCGQRVPDRQAGVRIRAGVDNDAVRVPAQPLYFVGERALMVRLGERDLDAQFARHGTQPRLDVSERRGSVDLGFSRTERSEEHTSELQSQSNLVCRLLLEKKKQ